MSNTNVFCHSCGAKLLLNSKFCSSCGTSLASLSSKPTRPIYQPNEPTIAATEGDEDSNYLDRITHFTPQTAGLEIEFDKPLKFRESIGNLVSNPLPPPLPIIANPNAPQINQEEFFKEFQKEAGSPAKRMGNEIGE